MLSLSHWRHARGGAVPTSLFDRLRTRFGGSGRDPDGLILSLSKDEAGTMAGVHLSEPACP